MQQKVVIHWIRGEGNGYFSLHLPDTTNKSTPQQLNHGLSVQKVQIGRKKQARSREFHVVLAPRCTRGIKVGGKKKARTAFYNKKREISNGKKREAPDEGEKQLIEEKGNN